MNQLTETTDSVFEALEDKVNRAVALIHRLREEKQRLAEANAILEARLAAAEAQDASGQIEELTARVARLEKERSHWQDERRSLTRRVEDILAKLEFLESESVPH